MFEWKEPRAGTVCFPLLKQVPNEAAENSSPSALTSLDAEAYCDSLVGKHGIMLLPASVYTDCDLPGFRLGFGRKNLPDIVKRWEKALQEVE